MSFFHRKNQTRKFRPAKKIRSFVPRLEKLESRLAPAAFDVTSIGALQSAIEKADALDDPNNIILVSGSYTSGGELLIQDQPNTPTTITIKGQGENNTFLTANPNGSHRVVEIIGNNNLTVNFEDLTIKGGEVASKKPTVDAQGGGMLIEGGNVMLSNVAVTGNKAVGGTGSAGGPGVTGREASALNGGAGGKGGDAKGGGIYLASGSLTLTNATISGNGALGGKGGVGADGATQLTSYAPTSPSQGNGAAGDNGEAGAVPGGEGGDGGDGEEGQEGAGAASPKNGGGGDGGDGGDAKGGGIYVAAGQLTISNNTTISSNTAQGGGGGDGGAPGRHLSNDGFSGGRGGAGGSGGAGGDATTPSGVGGAGGKGGMGAAGGKGGDGVDGGDGGKGGGGGDAEGGGLYLASGSLTVVSTAVTSNAATGGKGAVGASGDDGGDGGNGGGGGNGGDGGAGGQNQTVPQSVTQSLVPHNGQPSGDGGDAGSGRDHGDGGDGGDGGKDGDGGDGGAGRGGGFFIEDGTVTIVATTFTSNTATGGQGADGGDGGKGGDGGDGNDGGDGGIGGDDHHGGDGGNGGTGGDGGKGGEGGEPGDGGNGGDGLGGGVYVAGGKVQIIQGKFSQDSALGSNGGNGGAAGPGGDGGQGGGGGSGGNGGAGSGSSGGGGHGGNDGGGGNGGGAGHPGNGGNGEGGAVYLASGFLSLNGPSLAGAAQGGKAGAVGALGAGGDGGDGGDAGQEGQGGDGTPPGADGKEGDEGGDGSPGSHGSMSGSGSDGTSADPTIFGTAGADTTPPTVTLYAPNVNSGNASSLNPYTFTVAYSVSVLVNQASIGGAVVQVQPPGGGASITTTEVNTTTWGLQDQQGDAQTIFVTYQLTPPGGSWSSAPAGVYAVNLVSSSPTDLAGNLAPTGALGNFTVNSSISLGPSSLPAGDVGLAYDHTITASGGSGVLTLSASVVSGALPAGLTITGGAKLTISGTPTASGTVTLVVTAKDTAGDSASQNYTLTINPVVTLSPSALSAGIVGAFYNQSIAASGGSGTNTLSYFVDSGTFPAGLTITTNPNQLTISGMPTASGALALAVTATDQVVGSTTQNYTLTVNPALTFSLASLPTGDVGKAYSQTITAEGGSGGQTVSYQVVSGGIPVGLTFTTSSNQLKIGGTPKDNGTVTFTVTATDNNGDNATQSYTLSVAPFNIQLSVPITPTQVLTGLANATPSSPYPLLDGDVGTAYQQTITAGGGDGDKTLTFQVTSGALPAGLTITASPNQLAISGTPTATGFVTLAVTASDQNGDSATQDYRLTVNPAESMAFSPNTLLGGTVGAAYDQFIAASSGSGTVYVSYSVTSGAIPTGLLILPGTNRLTISGTPTASGSVTFTATAMDLAGVTSTKSYTLAVNSAGPISFNLPTLSPAAVGSCYSQSIEANGGSSLNDTITGYQITSGSIPAGLTFAIGKPLLGFGPIVGSPNSLQISGTPKDAGSVSFSVTAKDSAGNTATKSYTLTVNAPIEMSSNPLPSAVVGAAYNQTIAASGGVGNKTLTYSIASGSIPTGLTFALGTN